MVSVVYFQIFQKISPVVTILAPQRPGLVVYLCRVFHQGSHAEEVLAANVAIAWKLILAVPSIFVLSQVKRVIGLIFTVAAFERLVLSMFSQSVTDHIGPHCEPLLTNVASVGRAFCEIAFGLSFLLLRHARFLPRRRNKIVITIISMAIMMMMQMMLTCPTMWPTSLMASTASLPGPGGRETTSAFANHFVPTI